MRLRSRKRLAALRAMAAICEALDGRLLLSGSPGVDATLTAGVHNGVLEVTGTASGEKIAVVLSGSNLVVNDNGSAVGAFAQSGLTGIRILDRGGDDTLKVSSAVTLDATIKGGGGNDSLEGGGGDNVLVGGGGDNSVLRGGGEINLLVPGKESAITSSGGDGDTLIGSSGNNLNIADFSHRTDPLYLSNDGNDDSGDRAEGEAIEIMPNVNGIYGGEGNDTIIGTTGGDFLSGGAGNNLIVGTGIDNALVGGKGNNIFFANGAGPNSFFGGQGVNIAYLNTAYIDQDIIRNVSEILDPAMPADPAAIGAVISAAAAPTVSAQAEAAAAVTAKFVTITETVGTQTLVSTILKINGTADNDTISVAMSGADLVVEGNGVTVGSFPVAELSGKQRGVRINGKGGDNTLSVDPSVTTPATLMGGSGNDSLSGGGGPCLLIGNGGNDTLVGGANTSLLDPGNPNTFASSGGDDLLMSGSGQAFADFTHRTDNMFLSNDGMSDSGDASEGEHVTIMPGVTDLLGGVGNDTIVAAKAGAFLSGGGGNNSVHGGGAGDVLSGGTGQDTVVVAGEPVVLFLADGMPCQYSGVSDPGEDFLQLDSDDVEV